MPKATINPSVGQKTELITDESGKRYYKFCVSQPGAVDIRIYKTGGLLGQALEVNRYYYGDIGTGCHTFEWDGRNYAGEKVAAGVYFFVVNDYVQKAVRGPGYGIEDLVRQGYSLRRAMQITGKSFPPEWAKKPEYVDCIERNIRAGPEKGITVDFAEAQSLCKKLIAPPEPEEEEVPPEGPPPEEKPPENPPEKPPKKKIPTWIWAVVGVGAALILKGD